jgi:DNA-binding LytR/AlgR family response regulator
VDDGPLQLALREMRHLVTSPVALGGMAMAVLVLAVSGPFGTFAELGPSERFAYWALVVAPTYVLGQGSVTLVAEALRRRIAPFWPRLIVAALVSSLPIGAVVVLINTVFYGELSAEIALKIWFYVAVVTLAVTVVLGAAGMHVRQLLADAAVPAVAPPPETSSAPAILERVPLPQRGKLLALVVEDHYVDIVTDKGRTLVLLRLADAIREAAGVEGLQIHRSHWVASAAVVKTHRADGKVLLELTNGMRLPVSRGFLPQARAAGLA